MADSSKDDQTASAEAEAKVAPAPKPTAKPSDDLFADFAGVAELVSEVGLSEASSQIVLRSGQVNTFPFFSNAKNEYVSAGLKFTRGSLLTLRFYRQIIGGAASLSLPNEEKEYQFILEGSIGLTDDTLGLIDPDTGEIVVPPVLLDAKTQMWRNRMHIVSFQQMGANEETAETLKSICERARYVEAPLDATRPNSGAREYIWRLNPQGESPQERLTEGVEVTRMVVSVDTRTDSSDNFIGFRDFLTATMANITRAVKANAENKKSPNAYLGELTGVQMDANGSLYAARPGMPEMSVIDFKGDERDLVLVKRKNGPSAGVFQG